MIIESIHIKNYRSILDEKINCEELTALVGANGTGKSSFLRAIGLFYNTSPTWYKGTWKNGLRINGTWKNGDFLQGTWLNGTFENGTMGSLS